MFGDVDFPKISTRFSSDFWACGIFFFASNCGAEDRILRSDIERILRPFDLKPISPWILSGVTPGASIFVSFDAEFPFGAAGPENFKFRNKWVFRNSLKLNVDIVYYLYLFKFIYIVYYCVLLCTVTVSTLCISFEMTLVHIWYPDNVILYLNAFFFTLCSSEVFLNR